MTVLKHKAITERNTGLFVTHPLAQEGLELLPPRCLGLCIACVAKGRGPQPPRRCVAIWGWAQD